MSVPFRQHQVEFLLKRVLYFQRLTAGLVCSSPLLCKERSATDNNVTANFYSRINLFNHLHPLTRIAMRTAARKTEKLTQICGHREKIQNIRNIIFTFSKYKYIFQKKKQQLYFAVGTVRMFIEPCAKHPLLLGKPVPRNKKARVKYYTTLSTIFQCKDVQYTIIVYIKC